MSKPANRRDENVNREDENINTKKGFMISLPNKKNGEKKTSGIVDAKTINGSNDNAKDAPRQNENGGQNGGKNRDNHRNNHRNNRPQKTENETTAQANAPTKNPEKQGDKPQQKNQKHNRNQGRFADRQEKVEKNDKNERNERNERNEKSQNEQRNNNRGGKNRDNRDNRGGKNHGKNRDKFERNEVRKVIDIPGLNSWRNSDISETSEQLEKERRVKEPSLEEKYKNMPTLAEQIEAEEKKRNAFRMIADVAEAPSRKLLNGKSEDEQNAILKSAQIEEYSYEIIGVRFREAGKVYYFDPNGASATFGTPVIVETARGIEYGYTAIANRIIPAQGVVSPIKKIKRVATKADTDKYLANKALEKDAEGIFKREVERLELAMLFVSVEYTFDNSKLLFYFTAETRIDFRELVKSLASIFHTRIELRQIGVRDESKMLGGLGVCGRCVCCNAYLNDFTQVSIKMAKEQGLSLNAAKISGSCGKLMCCLRYEDKVYEMENADLPRVGAIVETKDGNGTVAQVEILKGKIKVNLENTPEAPPKEFSRGEFKIIGNKKQQNEMESEEELGDIEE